MDSGFLLIVIFLTIFGINWSGVEAIGSIDTKDVNEYPYLAGIRSKTDRQFLCHAVAFNSTHLVSRASCIPGANDSSAYSSLEVFRQVEKWDDFSQPTKGNSELKSIQEIIVYNIKHSCQNNDMAIIKVDPPFKGYNGKQDSKVAHMTFNYFKKPKGKGHIVSYGEQEMDKDKKPKNASRQLTYQEINILGPGTNPNPAAQVSNANVIEANFAAGSSQASDQAGILCPLDDAAPVFFEGKLVGLVIAKPDICYEAPIKFLDIGKYACWFHSPDNAFQSCDQESKHTADVYCKAGRFSSSDVTILVILSSILTRQLFFN